VKALFLGAAVLIAVPAAAQPDLRRAQPAGTLTVFSDVRRAGLFYYVPGEMAVAQSAGGKPELTFLHVRYTGTGAMGDRGRTFFRSVLTFRVRFGGPSATELRDAKTLLRRSATASSIELRPLPIRRLDAALVFATLSSGAESPAPAVVSEGHFEPVEDKTPPTTTDEGIWRERTYTVGMEPATAQMFSDALERGRVALSLGYALYANARAADEPIDDLQGSPELVEALRNRAPQNQAPAGDGTEVGPQLVRAGAIAITADARQWPDLVRRIDINESVPPGYAALDIYCYDFNNDLRPDLYEKQVEIEAQSVTGRPVRRLVAFQRDQADLYARTLSFSVAVRLDRPYRYRLVEVTPDGATRAGAWQNGQSWTQILDVTTRPEKGTEDQTWRSR
jgi:hypothetical protein